MCFEGQDGAGTFQDITFRSVCDILGRHRKIVSPRWYTSLPNSHSVTSHLPGNQPRWEHLHHGNRQTLPASGASHAPPGPHCLNIPSTSQLYPVSLREKPSHDYHYLGGRVLNLSGPRDQFHAGQFFYRLRQKDGLGMIQVHNIYYALYFCYCYISLSDNCALDPGS